MSQDRRYACEKLQTVVDGMARSSAPIQQRIVDAVAGLATLKEDDFPENLRINFREITAQRGAVSEEMPAEKAKKLADIIVELRGRVCGG